MRWRKSSRSSAAANCVEVAFLDAAWCKSSRSGANANCVEVAFLDAGWQKSSHSTAAANCVEIAFAGPAVGVRDSKDPGGAVLAFPADRWSRFVESLR
ncbi:DUF397 domain-containing protein [Saccharopolyspora sp. ASAGF58]|nr:DUF397 domain-containing protein [Saccharopolyspora sp. ASAGF58]